MEYYQQKFGNIGKQKIVKIVGYNHNDVIVQDLDDSFRAAINWDAFHTFYRKMEPFECDVSKYEGADLDR